MRRCYAYIVLLLVGFCLYASAQAADKIRIGFPDLAAPFVPLAIADKRNFFQEEGIQAETIRMNPAVALQALVGGEIDYYTVLGPEWQRRFVAFRLSYWLRLYPSPLPR